MFAFTRFTCVRENDFNPSPIDPDPTPPVLELAAELAPALAVQLRIKDIIDNIATGNTAGWTKTPANALTQDVSGTPGSAPAATAAQARIQEMYDTINTGTAPTTLA